MHFRMVVDFYIMTLHSPFLIVTSLFHGGHFIISSSTLQYYNLPSGCLTVATSLFHYNVTLLLQIITSSTQHHYIFVPQYQHHHLIIVTWSSHCHFHTVVKLSSHHGCILIIPFIIHCIMLFIILIIN